MLYVFESPTCDVCKEGRPHVLALEKETRGTPPIIRLNPNLMDWNISGFRPKHTPSYAVVDRSKVLGAVEGQMLTLAQLKKFLAKPSEFAREQRIARKAARAAEEEAEEQKEENDEEDE